MKTKRLLLPFFGFIIAIALLLSILTAWSLYPHADFQALPADLIAFDSEQGIERLAASDAMADYRPLLVHFEPQVAVSFCGVASSVAVLNATGRHTTQVTFFNDNTDKVRHDWQVLFGGMNLDELAGLLEAHGATVTVQHANTLNVDAFRETVARNLSTAGDYLLVNYQREVLGQGNVGHISPLAAYERKSDSVLIMDTAAHKYPPTWVPLPLLVEAMKAVDGSSGRMRGFVEITP